MKKVLITGVTGQDGSNMVDHLLTNTENTIIGGVRRLSVKNHENIEHLKDEPRFKLIDLDVTDSINTNLIIQEEKPDYFINFAANSFVGTSWQMPVQHMMANALPVMYQLEALRKYAPNCRYYNAGSSEQFGDVDYSPQDINHPFKPRSPYGISKCTAHHIVKVWRESYDMYAVQGLLFNHEGVRRGEEFVTRKITKGVARIKRAMDQGVPFESLYLGNLEAKRDWSDSEDFVDGIWKMLRQEKHNKDLKKLPSRATNYNKLIKDYVLSSGETHSIKEFVEIAFDTVGVHGEWIGKDEKTRYNIERNGVIDSVVRIDKKFYRPNEVELLWGDSSPIRRDLRWEPKVNFKGLVEKMVKHDYEKIKCEGL